MRRPSLARRARRQRGQAMVEFALVAPIFFLLLFSVIELGLVMGGQNGLVASARELARFAAPFRVKTEADAQAVCNNKADPNRGFTHMLDNFMTRQIPGYSDANWGPTDRTVTYHWLLNPDNTTYYVQLEIHIVYYHQLHVPLVGGVIDRFDGTADDKLRLDATETMRIENDDLPNGTYTDVSCNV